MEFRESGCRDLLYRWLHLKFSLLFPPRFRLLPVYDYAHRCRPAYVPVVFSQTRITPMQQVHFTQTPYLVDKWYEGYRKGMWRKACVGVIVIKMWRQTTELREGQKQRKAGVGWDIKKIVSVWLMVLYDSLVSSDGQDDWQRVWPSVTVHHLGLPPLLRWARLPGLKRTTKTP